VVARVHFNIHVLDHVPQGAHDVSLNEFQGLLVLGPVGELALIVPLVLLGEFDLLVDAVVLHRHLFLLDVQLDLDLFDLHVQTHVVCLKVFQLHEERVVLVLDV